jgi:MinD superfamily P-loop ATPase
VSCWVSAGTGCTSYSSTKFAQAVVLITEKSAHGAKGVMLTQVRIAAARVPVLRVCW